MKIYEFSTKLHNRKNAAGQTVEKAFKGYKTFDYEAFDKGMAELIKKCSGEG